MKFRWLSYTRRRNTQEEKNTHEEETPVVNMSRGTTWGEEETKYLIKIWSDDSIKSMLEKTHKNSETYSIFSEKMRERGYERSGEQCHLKLKKNCGSST